MKKNVKIIISSIIIILITIALVYTSQKPIKVDTKKVITGDMSITITETGYVGEDLDINIFSLTTGKVVTVYVKKGDKVKNGEILAIIDTKNIENEIDKKEITFRSLLAQRGSAIANKQNTIQSLKNTRESLVGQLDNSLSENIKNEQLKIQENLVQTSKNIYDISLKEMENGNILLSQGAISKQDMENIKLANENNKSSYEDNVSQLNIIKLSEDNSQDSIKKQIDGIDIMIKNSSNDYMEIYYNTQMDFVVKEMEILKEQLKNGEIRSTIQGIIKDDQISKTNLATPNTPLFTISPYDGMITTYVSTRDIHSIVLEDSVNIIFRDRKGDISLEGTIAYISDEAVKKTTQLGLDDRKVLVKILPEENKVLKNGYDVDVSFKIASENNRIIIPVSCLYKKDNKDMVMIINNNIIEEKEVTLGMENMGDVVILDGINISDIVVTDLDANGLKIGKRAVSTN